jgi:hypothetical protein
MLHLEGKILLLLLVIKCNERITDKIIKEYNPKLVRLRFKYPKIGALTPIKLVTSNWSKGEKLLKLLILNCKLIFI